MDWQPAYGEVLKRWREARGFTQQRLADAVGRVRTTVNGWEKGRHLPAKSDMLATLRILRVDPARFFAEVGMRCGEMLAGVAKAPAGRSLHAISLIDELLDTGKAAEDAREGPEELRPQLDGLSQAIEALVTRMMAIRRERP